MEGRSGVGRGEVGRGGVGGDGWVGEGFLKGSKRRLHLPKILTFKFFFTISFGQADRQTL